MPGCFAVENMAKNIEAVYQNPNNTIHTFHSKFGLRICRGTPDEPTAAALACLAKCTGTPYWIVESRVAVGEAPRLNTALLWVVAPQHP